MDKSDVPPRDDKRGEARKSGGEVRGSPSSFRSSGESLTPTVASGMTTSRLNSSCPMAALLAALLAACDRGVRALRLNHAAGTASSHRPDPDGGTSGGDVGRSRNCSWHRLVRDRGAAATTMTAAADGGADDDNRVWWPRCRRRHTRGRCARRGWTAEKGRWNWEWW
ncbi:Os01g0524850 [Oryza sativa Japonica Group]|uniref:Os01g0524850 protein n=3 Tax=Oryza TaxID=4527 RepID=A0A0P0V3H3_ORYSJ|nr:Os01g0524850 [Oryza sativa Japonica Group]